MIIMSKILRKIKRVILLFVIIGFALGFLYLGYYFLKVSKKSYIYSSCIDQLFNKIEGYLKADSKYFLGDDFSISGDVDVELSSEDYNNRSLVEKEYLKKKNEIQNISNLGIAYQVRQDRSHKQLFLSLQEKLKEEDVFYAKYLVQDSTTYYYVKDIADQ